uniref:Uncharacterized protein n=1 Tax=Anguilla anguilla TaxID=7936 RepID=A0A0E9RA14_ANGAN
MWRYAMAYIEFVLCAPPLRSVLKHPVIFHGPRGWEVVIFGTQLFSRRQEPHYVKIEDSVEH